MKLRAVIFDRDGVLTSFDLRPAAELLSTVPGVSFDAVRALWFAYLAETRAPTSVAEEGAYLGTFWARVCDAHGLDGALRARLTGFDYRQIIRPFPDARWALEAVRAHGLRVAVLSNFPLADLQGSLERAGLADLIDDSLAASVIGASKPAPAAYERALEALGVRAHECALVDDEPACVQGALALGIDAYLLDRTGTASTGAMPAVRDLHSFVAALAPRLA